MAGKQHTAASSSAVNWKITKSSRSSMYLLFVLTLIALSILYWVFSSSPSSSLLTLPNISVSLNPNADYSFVSSLEKFLTSSASYAGARRDDTAADVANENVQRLDDALWMTETRNLYEGPLLPLKVYVYQMPPKFTYDLLWLFRNTYKETFNLTSNGSPVHRLIEQHSVDYWLWADLIAPQSERLLRSVVRVDKQEEADLFYIPLFTTISFFLMETQQCKALYRVMP